MKSSDDNLHAMVVKHLDISKNKMLSESIREESRTIAQFLVELVGFRKYLDKIKKESERAKK